jgi:hypothetical protein
MANGYIIEFRQIGNFIKVSAVCQQTLKEISMVFPAGKGLSKDEMSKMAVRRLEYVLRKKNTPVT